MRRPGQPKNKISRRLGFDVYGTGGASLQRRLETPPAVDGAGVGVKVVTANSCARSRRSRRSTGWTSERCAGNSRPRQARKARPARTS